MTAKKTIKLKLEESLNIEETGELKKKFDKSLSEGVQISIHSGVITDIDLSGIQLLEYMIRQAGSKGADLKFNCKLEDSQKKLLTKCGFNSITEIVFA